MEYDLPESGVHHIYFPADPSRKIVKAQAELVKNKVKIKVVVNLKYAGESYFEDEGNLKDGDSIYAEPDGLVILRGDTQPEYNLKGWDGEYIHVAEYVDGVLMLFVSREP